MHFSKVICAASAVSVAYGHGLVTSVEGANGVTMPGLSVIAGTPRDCSNPLCGSEDDTSIIRKNELGSGRASALGRTPKGGPVDAAAAVSDFMGGGNGGGAVQQGGNQRQAQQQQQGGNQQQGGGGIGGLLNGLSGIIKRGILDGILGGGGGGAGKAQKLASNSAPAPSMSGMGASQGMPTCDDNGVVRMTYRQVNQDGAGPLSAALDCTSGGTDPSAFVPVKMIDDVPGVIAGLSAASKADFAISAQMPPGTECKGEVAGQTGVCVMRLNNNALAGPFGGSVAFVQSPKARKRAIEYNLRKRELEAKLAKRHFARGLTLGRD